MTELRRELEAPFQSALVELYELDMKPLIGGLTYKESRQYDQIRFDPDTGEQIVSPSVRPARVEFMPAENQYGFFDPTGTARWNAMRYLRFCNDRNELGEPVVFMGKTFMPYPIKVEGFAVTGNGRLPRPSMTLANVTGVLTALAGGYDDLLGARLRRIRTFGRFLDAVNFATGNPEADPNARLPDDIWIIDKKVSEDRMAVKFELASLMDLEGVQLPRRKIVSSSCTWGYRSAECTYTGQPGDPGFIPRQVDDSPVPGWQALPPEEQLRLDSCGHRISSCKARFGTGTLPYGGFPGALLYAR